MLKQVWQAARVRGGRQGLIRPGVPMSEMSESRRADQPPRILNAEEQEEMRVVCRVRVPPTYFVIWR
jgi:hypothetical protein